MDNDKPLTKGEFEGWATDTKETLNSIEQNVASLGQSLQRSEQRILSSIEGLATQVNDILKKDYPFQKKRISRVELHTKTLLGKKLDKTNVEFEDQYNGEERLRQQEAAGG